MILLDAITSDSVISMNVGMLVTIVLMIGSGITGFVRFSNRIMKIENNRKSDKALSDQKIDQLMSTMNDYKDQCEKQIEEAKQISKSNYKQLEKKIDKNIETTEKIFEKVMKLK